MLYCGIDWSDQALDFHLRTGEGQVLCAGKVEPNPEGLAELFAATEAHAPPGEIGIAVETAHGAWLQALLDRGYTVYPVNPKTVERFREALSAMGNKSDTIDRKVLAMFLVSFHQDLHPLRPDAPEIIGLRIACQDRVRLVEERTAKLNELRAVLKIHYPAALKLFGELDSRITLTFLEQYPTQNQLRALTPRRLRNWLRRHGYTAPQRIDGMVAQLTAPVLPVADYLQAAKAPLIVYLTRTLTALQAEIAERERQITQQFDQLPEADWIRSLPRTGENLAPALLACLGRDPHRFATVAAAQALMGTAPVTKTSGRSRIVHFRRGCWKFARRTLQLFADQTRHDCPWAQAFYTKQRQRGHTHHQALRALAHRWLKILLAMRRTGSTYDENIFVNSQRRYLLNASARGS